MKRIFDFLNRLADADDDRWDSIESVTHYLTVLVIASFVTLMIFQFTR